MSIQPLLPSSYVSYAQAMQRSQSTNSTSAADDADPLGILSGSADATSNDPLDALFGDDGTSNTDSLASFLGSSSDTQSVFDSFTAEAQQVLLQAQEESQNHSTTTDGTKTATDATDKSATTSAMNDPQVQALLALMSPSTQSAAASWL